MRIKVNRNNFKFTRRWNLQRAVEWVVKRV